MPEITVALRISSSEYLTYYEGAVDSVTATASDGRIVRFPARVLRPYLTHKGIIGEFVLIFDEQRKFVSLKKVRDL